MQYAVPQFTEVEDKLIGPLTLKQFLMVLGTGALVLFFWSVLGLSFFFFVFALPVAGIGLMLTFGKFNGRSFYTYLFPFLGFFASQKVLVFKREPGAVLDQRIEVRKITAKKEVVSESTGSRLKKLAYLLDQKSHEEEELVAGMPNAK